MRWLRRSVLLCLLIVVVTPAPADAWFEWLHRLSGPGPWYGGKVDVRAVCFGPSVSAFRADARSLTDLRKDLESASGFADAEEELRLRIAELRKIDRSLQVLKPRQLEIIERQLDTYSAWRSNRSVSNERQSALVGGAESQTTLLDRSLNSLEQAQTELQPVMMLTGLPGILISLCPENKLRTFAIEIGSTISGAFGEEKYARDHGIGMVIGTIGVSYRVPLPFDRDIIDLGTNFGGAVFYSKEFKPVYAPAIEPFVDLHLPTSFQISASKWERFFGRFTVRGGLQFFPGGFRAAEFAALPGTPDISGREATPSVTVFYRIKGGPSAVKPIASSPRPGA